ncbi:hypothetical protein [Natronincola ferrireducens]|uniref:Uncharacterized protein n=1 Tax=Natronincola ferrireducens TaxID=393762 RepID=A0A1G9HM99_9FIRM|nr:hypothetical protein [Natronincola ferrireducens]SDL14012.1 hypothetical protein SAMN05660472_02679 [Natronincola ferrireducens]
MIRKLIVSTVVLFILGSCSTVAYANNTTTTTQESAQEAKVEEQSIKVITPSRNMVVSDNNMVLAFTAPEGTTVTIDVYYNTSVDTNRPNYVPAYDPILVEVGALQRGWAEVELRKGFNKVDFIAIYKNGVKDVISRVIEVKDIKEVKEQVERSVSSTSSTNALRNIVNTENKQ